jgi:AraC-like DNA-binding protein
MERFTTAGLPASGRTAAWNAIYATRMSRVEFTPADRHKFDAELRVGRLGPVKLAKLSVDRCSVERAQSHISISRGSARLYSFLLQAKGHSRFYHCGNEARLSEGDFVLCDTGLPHYFMTEDPSVTIMVQVLPEVLREYLPSPEQFCGLHLGRAVGVTNMVAAMVETLIDKVETGVVPGYDSRVARYLLEMISMTYTMGFESVPKGSAVLWQRRNDVIRYIEDNLRDPALSAASIAEGLRLSQRYLRTIFSISGEKISAYIMRRRLEECARQMRIPAWSGHTLTEIAFSWGFNSAAHFTRSFHEQFGVTPRDFRRSALDSQISLS